MSYAVELTGEEFVHVTPRRFVPAILQRGLDPMVSGGRVYVTKYRYIVGKSAADLETMLYRRTLQGGKIGYFSQGGLSIIVLPPDIAVIYRGVTTRPGGVPQWTYEGPALTNLHILEVP